MDSGDSGQRVAGHENAVEQAPEHEKDAARIAILAGSGAAIGGFADQSIKGASIGAGVGSAVGLATVLLSRGREVELRPGKVMLDSHLAELYEVPTFRLNEAVKRNRRRFPEDFMFHLTGEEAEVLTSQIAISKPSRGGRRTLPCVFTEQGVAMLATVLNSERAIAVNIAIMRTFVRLRQILATHKELAERLAALEKKCELRPYPISAA